MVQTPHGFLEARRALNVDLDDAGIDLKEYPNIPRSIGSILSTRMATLRELDEFYSIEDVYDMLEVVAIDEHNRKLLTPKGSDQ